MMEIVVIENKPHKAGPQWKFAGAFYFSTVVLAMIGKWDRTLFNLQQNINVLDGLWSYFSYFPSAYRIWPLYPSNNWWESILHGLRNGRSA